MAVVQHQIGAKFSDSPTLGDLVEVVTSMLDAGAPADAEILLTLGDKGNQRDPWRYIAGLTAKWEGR